MTQKGTLCYERLQVQSLSLISVAECVVHGASNTKVMGLIPRDHMHTDQMCTLNACMSAKSINVGDPKTVKMNWSLAQGS